MSTRLLQSPAQVMLAAQASKALYIINQVYYNCNYSLNQLAIFLINVLCQLYYMVVRYGAPMSITLLNMCI